ncbi:hypothetical protein D3C72_2255870 [compost metagenome]
MEDAAAPGGGQAAARDQFQDEAIGPGEVDRLRLPAALETEVLAPLGIALTLGAGIQPAGRFAEAVVRHVEGQVHAADRQRGSIGKLQG